MLRQHGHLETTLFEQPSVIKVARQRLIGKPFARKINLVEGDILKDPLPKGHDAFLVANVVHYFFPKQNQDLFRRIRECSPDGGRLLVVDFWTDVTHTQPPFAAIMGGEFLIQAGGDIFSTEEAREWLQKSGWHMVDHPPLAGLLSLVVAEAD